MTIRFVLASAACDAAEPRWALTQIAPLLDARWSRCRFDSDAARAAFAGDDPLVWVGPESEAPPGAAAVVVVEDWPKWRPEDVKLGAFERVPLPCPGGACPPPADPRVLPAPWLRAIAWTMSREEEYDDPRRDQWTCYAGGYTRLHELGVLERPIVNELVERLRARLDHWAAARGRTLERVPRWKGGARFAATLSHDVDDTSLHSLPQALRLLARARSPRSYAARAGLAAAVRALRAGRTVDPYWNIEGRRTTVRELFRTLAARGFEVGLHGSYETFRDGAELVRQKAQVEAAIGAPLAGTRQHFLRWDVRVTPRAHAEARFAYDATLGYNESPGFRCGVAAPFEWLDRGTGAALDLLEVPMTCMDGALFRTLRLDAAGATARVLDQLATVESVGGLAGLLWHPNAAAESVFPGWWPPYVAALDRLAERGAWVAPAAEVAGWWRERNASLRA